MPKEIRLFPVGLHSSNMILQEMRWTKASTGGGPSMKAAEIQTLGHAGQTYNVTQSVREDPAPILYNMHWGQ